MSDRDWIIPNLDPDQLTALAEVLVRLRDEADWPVSEGGKSIRLENGLEVEVTKQDGRYISARVRNPNA